MFALLLHELRAAWPLHLVLSYDADSLHVGIDLYEPSQDLILSAVNLESIRGVL